MRFEIERIMCDQCGGFVDVPVKRDGGNPLPHGWVSVVLPRDGQRVSGIFCSVDCAVRVLRAGMEVPAP